MIYTYEIVEFRPQNDFMSVKFMAEGKADVFQNFNPLFWDEARVNAAIKDRFEIVQQIWDKIENPPQVEDLTGLTYEASSDDLPEEIEDDEDQEELTPSQQVERLTNVIANTRYQAERQGLVWVDSEDVSWFLDTSTESQNRFASARLAVEAGTRSDGSVWKCATLDEYGTPSLVFRPTTNLEIIEWSDLCHAHVQKCFEAEALAAGKALSGDLNADFMTEFVAL